MNIEEKLDGFDAFGQGSACLSGESPYGIGSEHSVCPHEGASKATNCFLSTAAMAVSIRAPDMVNERIQKTGWQRLTSLRELEP